MTANESKQAGVIEGQPVSVPWDMFDLMYRVLMYYANYTTYQAQRTGGVLKGCPRGPAPTPPQLASEARWTIRRINQELLARESYFDEDEAGVFKDLAAAIAERDALSRQLSEAVGELNRRKGDAATRLHNICENLSEQANESPFTREEWERIDAENVALRRERDTAREALGRAMSDTEQLRDIADSVGLPALRAMANQMLEQGRAALANCATPEEKP